jgi:N-acetylglucosaminyldiphosphoundecaprenol N-acetyl-beta-D-mannosaminyltransferase
MTRIRLDGLAFDDIGSNELISRVVDMAVKPVDRHLCIALHVTALNAMRDIKFIAACDDADVIYADGYSVALAARICGAAHAERLATTDLLVPVIEQFRNRTGRRPRVSMIGGKDGIAGRALKHLVELDLAEPGVAIHGYHATWNSPLEEIRHAGADITLVGMGMPREVMWLGTWRTELPIGLYLTCGGLLRLLAGDEKRAPLIVQHLRVEWLYRWIFTPSRVGSRYLVGLMSLLRLIMRRLLVRGRR